MSKTFSPPNTSAALGGSTMLDRLMSMVKRVTDALKNAVTNDVLVQVVLGTGDTVVTHGMGAFPTSWDVVDITANATVWRTAPPTKTTVTLRASAACIATIRFNSSVSTVRYE